MHELRQLIGGAEAIGAVKAIGEGIIGSEIVVEAFLLGGPVEELGSEGGVRLEFEDFGDEVGSDAAELVEFGDYGWAPTVLVLAEGVGDESSDGGEAEEGGVVVESVGSGGRLREEVRVPVVEIEGLGFGGLGFGEGEGLAVGEEAAANGGAVLGRLTVAVEEVEFVLGFWDWGLRCHFFCCLLSSLPFVISSF